jgi:hypothetical protein
MTAGIALPDARDQTLRKIGRNMVNFQKMEAMLRFLWLASFDPNSAESCLSLGVDLDEQHARIWPEFETLKAIVQAVHEYQREAMQYLAADAFLAELKERIPSA